MGWDEMGRVRRDLWLGKIGDDSRWRGKERDRKKG